MSSHFKGRTETERRTSLWYWLSPTRERTGAEQRFVWHAYTRGGLVLAFMLYFTYCNPESTLFYKHLRTRWGWDDSPPLFPQYLKWEFLFPTMQPPWARVVSANDDKCSEDDQKKKPLS